MQATKRVKDPRKQRKLLHNAPAHMRHKLMAAPLSKELAASKGAKTLPVRKGDTIRIMRGDHSGFEGKVSRVDLKRYRIFVEGLTREKVDGTNIFVAVHPSKVMIRSLNLDDKWRKAIVDRKHELELPLKEEKEKTTPKPAKKSVELKGEEPVEKPRVIPKSEKARREKKTAEKPRVTQERPVSEKEEVPTTKEKPVAGKRKIKAPTKKEKAAGKETKSVVATKIPRKRKTVASKKEGGT
jgi:large subunit ribosomal protein L24